MRLFRLDGSDPPPAHPNRRSGSGRPPQRDTALLGPCGGGDVRWHVLDRVACAARTRFLRTPLAWQYDNGIARDTQPHRSLTGLPGQFLRRLDPQFALSGGDGIDDSRGSIATGDAKPLDGTWMECAIQRSGSAAARSATRCNRLLGHLSIGSVTERASSACCQAPSGGICASFPLHTSATRVRRAA